MDLAFIDVLNSGETDVSPASITNGAPTIQSTGVWKNDFAALFSEFGGDLSTSYFVTDPSTAVHLAMLNPSLFPDLGARGGTAFGIPVLTSRSSPRPGSPASGQIALIDPTGIVVGDGQATVRIARQASIELLDNPVGDGIAPTATSLVSLWQVNAVGIAAQLTTNWHRARPGSVVTLVNFRLLCRCMR